MGFGFNLFLVFILFPFLVAIILIALFWLIFGKKLFKRSLIVLLSSLWNILLVRIFIYCTATGALLFISLLCFSVLNQKVNLNHDDIFGTYIIDRSMFRGKQADWQYNHLRFRFKTNNQFQLFITDSCRIVKIYSGNFKFLDIYDGSPRITLELNPALRSFTDSCPMLVRGKWSFKFVLNSPMYHNIFFKRGDWKSIK